MNQYCPRDSDNKKRLINTCYHKQEANSLDDLTNNSFGNL